MGTLLKAICPHCRFHRDSIYYGSGFKNQTPQIPAIEKDTGEFVVAELSHDDHLRFYHQPDMYKGRIKDEGIQEGDIHLSPDHNLCPECGEYTMRFEAWGNWD